MTAPEDFYVVGLPYATVGVIVQDGVVTETAPITRWMVGKDWDYVQKWVARKKGTVTTVRSVLDYVNQDQP